MRDVETRRVAVISTAHLSPATIETLSGPMIGWPVYGGPIGSRSSRGPDAFMVHVSSEPGEDCPSDLVAIFDWAAPDFDYILIDIDGPIGEGLATYEETSDDEKHVLSDEEREEILEAKGLL